MIELVNPDLWVTRGYMIRELYYSKHHCHAISYKYIIYNIDCPREARGPQRGCNLVRLPCNPSVIFVICNLDFVITNP